MSQTPTPDSPQQPDPSQQQPTQPLWYGEPSRQQASYAGAGAPSYPPDPAAPSHQQSSPWGTGADSTAGAHPRRRRWTEIGSVAALAAVLASGTTYAVTHGDVTADSTNGPMATTRQLTQTAPVAQANPQAPNWSATAAAVSPSVVSITVKSQQGGAQGSGVIIDGKGRVVTNNHVVAGAGGGQSELSVTLTDGRTYSASVVGTDPSTDLAVIQMQNAPSDLVPIRTGNADTLRVGDPVMAVGNPLGLAGTVTTGIVSALNRPVTTSQEESPSQDPFGQNQQQGEPVVTNAIQTSAAINPGNSGGALVNASGQLVGINSSIASVGSSDTGGQSGNIGIGFAIPVNEVTSIADQLVADGKAEHAYLGVSTQDDSVKDGSAERAAASVTAVVGGTPAAKAGLQRGDAIVAVDGEPVDSGLSLVAQVRERGVGDKAKLTIVRDGQRRDIEVTLASKPSSNQ
jgi:putative serine protease PepD